MDEIGKGDVYKAERILDTKNVKGKRYFLIKWDGWNDSNNTWEPEKNIIDTRLIDSFYELRKNPSLKDASSKKLSDSNNPTPKEREKSFSQASHNSRKEDDLRSVIRIAEGLRPLSKSYQSSLNKSSGIHKNKSVNATLLSDTSSSSDSSSNRETKKAVKQNMRTRTISTTNSKSTNRFMRRRKLSSSSVDSSLSGSSSLTTSKRTINRNKVYSEDEERDLNEKSSKSMNKSTEAFKFKRKATVDDADSSADQSASSLFDDDNFLNSANEDIFITDITSGFVTVTIKESFSPAGFFKTRSTT